MSLTTFRKAYELNVGGADKCLDNISDQLDEIDSEGEHVAAARAAFVQAQLAMADLARKLAAITEDDLDDELADREDEDEDEEDETESA